MLILTGIMTFNEQITENMEKKYFTYIIHTGLSTTLAPPAQPKLQGVLA